MHMVSNSVYLFACVLTSGTLLASSFPAYVEIDQIRTQGMGCPDNSVRAEVLNSANNLVVRFDDFEVEKTQRLSFCTSYMRLKYPTGWSFSIVGSAVHGYANLGLGRRGVVRLSYDWSFGNRSYLSYTLPAPFVGDFSHTKNEENEYWTPCGEQGYFSFHSSISSGDLPYGSSEAFTFSKTGENENDRGIEFLLKWRPCH